MKVKTLRVEDGKKLRIDKFPSFHKTGSIDGMKKKYYGENAFLVRCGNWIYNVTPDIYNQAH